MKAKLNTLIFLTIALSVQMASANKLSLPEQRKAFVSVEKLIRNGNNEHFLQQSKTLKDYPLYPYLQYQWLIKNLHKTNEIKAFLKNNANTRYAGVLKLNWQSYLAKQKKWQTFIAHYTQTKNNKMQCHYLWAKYHTGAKEEALQEAKKIWVTGKSLPAECDSIFKVLKNSSHFTRDMLWTRFDAALTNKKVSLARYVKKLMNEKDQNVADLWLKIYSNPSLLKDKQLLKPKSAQSGLIFAHGIHRLARSNLGKAIEIWDKGKNTFKINKDRKNQIEQRLAMALAYRSDEKAYSRLSQLESPDESTREWRVRVALKNRNWHQVEQSINQLDRKVQNEEKWKYWLARALENSQETKIADYIFSKLSKNRSYYGYLAANKLNQKIELSDRPVQITEKTLEKFKQKTDFRVVAELIEQKKLTEAKRQWWYAVKKLENKEKITAAKYAQQLHWKQTAIFTIAKAKYWDDVSLRFPLAYETQVKNNAVKQKLNPAVIYGLIRQESAFDQNARSHAGARGLMQIMPKTGQQIARELKEKWRNKNQLLMPETNIKYGSYYYKQLLNKFNGHYALAAAAYNAGPHRVKRWMPAENTLAADIWIETIPFKETRRYVSAVLTYALIYQKKLNKNQLTMNDFMRDVVPG